MNLFNYISTKNIDNMKYTHSYKHRRDLVVNRLRVIFLRTTVL